MNQGTNKDSLNEALRQQEARITHDLPSFAIIAARIDAEPSPLEASRWPVGASVRLAWSLAVSQLRVIPLTVLPAALVVAVVAAWAANSVAFTQTAADATWCLSAILLLGVALTVTLALPTTDADTVALATPLGPQAITLARLAVVLGVDALGGIVATAVAVSLGVSADFGTVATGWLVPFAAIAGTAAFFAIWTGVPWVGTMLGVALVPLVLPVAPVLSEAGILVLATTLRGALGPTGIVVMGVVLLAAAICSARRATLVRLQAT